MKKYLTKNKVYTYKDATVYEVFEVKISGLTEIEEKMFSAFEFAEYSQFFGAEDMAQIAAGTDDELSAVCRLAFQNAKANVSVTTVYMTKTEHKALLSEFVDQIEFSPEHSGKIGEVRFSATSDGDEELTFTVTCGKAGCSSALAAILSVYAKSADTASAKANALSKAVSCPAIARPSCRDFSVFVSDGSLDCDTLSVGFETSKFERDFSVNPKFKALLEADVRKAAILALSDKNAGACAELQKSFASLEKGYSAFCGKGQTVPSCAVKFEKSGREFLLSANNRYDAEYNAVLALEDAVFAGADLDCETKLFASPAAKNLAEELGIGFSEIGADFAAVVTKTSPEKKRAESFFVSSKLYLLHLPRTEDKIPDFKSFSMILNSVAEAMDKGEIFAARSVADGGAAVSAIIGAMAEGKGVYFKNSAPELFAPFYGDVIISAPKKPNFAAIEIGEVIDNPQVIFGDDVVSMEIAKAAYELYWKKFYPKCDFSADVLRTEGMGFSNKSVYIGKPVKAKVAVPYFSDVSEVKDLYEGFLAAKGKPELIRMSALDKTELSASLKNFAKQVAASQILCFSSEKVAALLVNERVRDAVMQMLDAGGLILGVGGGFSALVKSGLLPFEKLTLPKMNPIKILPAERECQNSLAKVKISGNLSPWFNREVVGDVFSAAVFRDAVKVEMTAEDYSSLMADGLVATQFVDANGMAASDYPDNPTGSFNAVEGLTSPDGRILGRICHIPANLDVKGECFETKIYEAGIKYFK
ncbi:MAG: phosphoribosylformylglycinamidine synthase subunit PurQ, partial [Eubacteriales bacterium]|nr:phosphoribosylformylglycinamidine synthase subunit PurQ [Eubacteriales bacterium]